ncbi:MAG: OmpA family protein [Desulfosarcinaceae bacterium]|nr:OmpA family protein [Desulfosarcinaceae bacterium]
MQNRPTFTRVARLSLLLALGLLVGCTSQSVNLQPPGNGDDPLEMVNALGNKLSEARGEEVHILAPEWFEKSQKSYVDAKQGLESGKPLSAVINHIAAAEAQLQRAQTVSDLSRDTLAKALDARTMARKAGATNFTREYAKVETAFLNLTRAVEKNKLKQARAGQDDVVNSFNALEIRAIKVENLGEARRLIEAAEEQGARKRVPQAYAAAKSELDAVDAFISANPHDTEQMPTKAAKSLFMAQRLAVHTEESAKVADMKPESVVLWMEGILSKLGNGISAPDMRNRNFATQQANILGTMDAVQADRGFLSAEVTKQQQENADLKISHETQVQALNKRIAVLEGKTKADQEARERLAAERRAAEQKLEEQKRFKAKLNQVQQLFNAEEAEVYARGSQLVLRLRAIEFPVGQDIILPANYPLLSKVQQAIRTFGQPDVVIEGHTDSTGSYAVNQHLSQARAEAVRQYVVANQILAAEKLTAVGYGSERPLASNATVEGRAINRRIDVVINTAP